MVLAEGTVVAMVDYGGMSSVFFSDLAPWLWNVLPNAGIPLLGRTLAPYILGLVLFPETLRREGIPQCRRVGAQRTASGASMDAVHGREHVVLAEKATVHPGR